MLGKLDEDSNNNAVWGAGERLRNGSSWVLSSSSKAKADAEQAKADYHSALARALKAGQRYQDLSWNSNSQTRLAAASTEKVDAYAQAGIAAKKYDDCYRDNKTHLRYNLWPQKVEAFNSYLTEEERKYG